uniref:Photosystem I reaction center subunit VIII n=1 Tax=Trachelomonas volvocina TaxID=103340 RepID=A0A0G3VSH1_9EUGL|nr:photosystem I 4 kDa hydrophobic subunit [Trachelomonas volvocina]AKL82459.1 photosystem I 4 kDa hydrophobic subunit [Trachelomonas volvocina]
MSLSFLPSLLVPIVGFLTPLLIIIFFLRYVDKEQID